MANQIDEAIELVIDVIECEPATIQNGRFDVDGDGHITWRDANEIWQNREGQAPYNMKYDMNCDGIVNFQDAGLCWINREYGTCEDITDQSFCEAIGCYWYNGGCHSTLEGEADASNVVYDSPVEPGVIIVIDYDIQNIGAEDVIWCGIYDGPDETASLIGGYWEEIFAAGEIKQKRVEIPGISTPVVYYIQAGHVVE